MLILLRLLFSQLFYFGFSIFSKVLLCASCQMGSIVECWSLRKEGLPVNNIFQHRSPVGMLHVKGNHTSFMWHIALLESSSVLKCLLSFFSSSSVGEKQPMILKWRILSATNDLDRVSAIALPKLPISISNTDLKVASDTKFFPGLGMTFCACSFKKNTF